MHRITRNLWDRGLNIRKWSKLNNFSFRYVELVVAGKRGAWGVGVAKKIREALINQGFAEKSDFQEVEAIGNVN